MTHTPGPWEFVLDDDGVTDSVTFVIRMGSHLGGTNGWEPQHRIDYEVSSEESSLEQFAEAKANAALIVSAPDLLAALKSVLDQPETPAAYDAMIARVQAAIAKAEGR